MGRVCSSSWLGRRLARLRHDGCVLNGSPLCHPFERAERDRPGRPERERSGASTRPAARLDSLDLVDLVDLVGLLGAPLPN